MKKILVLICLATIFIGSCHKIGINDVTISCDTTMNILPNEISFTVTTGTKSSFKDYLPINSIDDLKAKGIWVIAAKNNEQQFCYQFKWNEEESAFICMGGNGLTRTHVFMNEGQTWEFFACQIENSNFYPYFSDGEKEGVIWHEKDSMFDTVYAYAVANHETSGPINLEFKHEGRIFQLEIICDDEDVEYNITNISLTSKWGQSFFIKREQQNNSSSDNDYTETIVSNGKMFTTEGEQDFNGGLTCEVMTYSPTVNVHIQWNCIGRASGETLSSNSHDFAISPKMGTKTIETIHLPSDIVYLEKPLLLPGIFTVNDSGKKVKFTKGNLYWNGSEFKCEENQYEYPTNRNTDHIGHFFWSKNAKVAYSANYVAANEEFSITPTIDDAFFATNDKAIEGCTVLSYDEWNYLIEHAIDGDLTKRVTVNEKNCVILKPDGFSGTIKDSYTATEWITAEAYGLVALPYAGFYYDSEMNDCESCGYYWTSSSYSESADFAWRRYFSMDNLSTDYRYRLYGYTVRLVSVI